MPLDTGCSTPSPGARGAGAGFLYLGWVQRPEFAEVRPNLGPTRLINVDKCLKLRRKCDAVHIFEQPIATLLHFYNTGNPLKKPAVALLSSGITFTPFFHPRRYLAIKPRQPLGRNRKMEKSLIANFNDADEQPISIATSTIAELSELQLALVGGGAGDTIWA